MAAWEDIIFKAKDITVAASKKACDYAGVASLKLEMAENNKLKNETLNALGKLLYDSRHDETSLDEEVVSELIAQVDELVAANAKLQTSIDALCGRKTCDCGAINDGSATFCNKCGKEL